jgi:hypothetical protein
LAGVLALAFSGCSGELPPPQTRGIIIYSGERIQTTPERMAEVERWLRPQLEHIDTSRDFLIRLVEEDGFRYPWDTLEIEGDTASVRIATTALDAETPYLIYAHLRLLEEEGRLEEWAPEAEGLEGFEAERAILTRVSDVWLLGRAAFDTHPYGPMDELLYANEFGYLEDFIFATQGDRFRTEEQSYREENPEREEEFRAWMLETFERELPGFLAEAADGSGPTG